MQHEQAGQAFLAQLAITNNDRNPAWKKGIDAKQPLAWFFSRYLSQVADGPIAWGGRNWQLNFDVMYNIARSGNALPEIFGRLEAAFAYCVVTPETKQGLLPIGKPKEADPAGATALASVVPLVLDNLDERFYTPTPQELSFMVATTSLLLHDAITSEKDVPELTGAIEEVVDYLDRNKEHKQVEPDAVNAETRIDALRHWVKSRREAERVARQQRWQQLADMRTTPPTRESSGSVSYVPLAEMSQPQPVDWQIATSGLGTVLSSMRDKIAAWRAGGVHDMIEVKGGDIQVQSGGQIVVPGNVAKEIRFFDIPKHTVGAVFAKSDDPDNVCRGAEVLLACLRDAQEANRKAFFDRPDHVSGFTQYCLYILSIYKDSFPQGVPPGLVITTRQVLTQLERIPWLGNETSPAQKLARTKVEQIRNFLSNFSPQPAEVVQ